MFPFALLSQCLQNPSSDIRLVAEKMIWWANKDPRPPLEPQTIKPILKALLDNTKDKNTVVRAYSDQAIVNLLKMRQGEELLQVGAGPGWQRHTLRPSVLCTAALAPCSLCQVVSCQGSRDSGAWGTEPLFSRLGSASDEVPGGPQAQDKNPGGAPCVPTLCPSLGGAWGEVL